MYLYEELNNDTSPISSISRLEALFEQVCQQKEMNHHPAIINENRTYSYDELNQMSNQLARFLIKQGVKSGDRIGIMLDKSVHTYVTLLAILKAHAAYVPLDISFPSDRIKFIAKDANLKYIISYSEFSFIFEENTIAPLYLDQFQIEIKQKNTQNLTESEKSPIIDNLCYIIYTSGTTGTPKGVAIEHESICNFVRVAAKSYGIQKSDRVYQGMIIAFDFSVEEIWVPLIAGATLVPAKSAKCMLGGELNDFLIDKKISVLCCVPTLLSTLEKDIPSLRLLLVGGEACPHDLVTKWQNKNRTILNTYGPTETTVTATYTELLAEKPVTIGKPLPSYSIVILDENLEPVPQGGLGEICIGGVGLARGYVNRDELTQEFFIPDFLNLPNNPSKRIYRTGDLGRINQDKEIEYLGRIDTQVKIRGYRIELSEIESVLLQVEGIAQVAVSTYSSDKGLVELVAYCVLEKGTNQLPTTLTSYLDKKLPGYMTPAYIEILDVLPMSLSNKVDRKKLPKPKTQRVINRTQKVIAPQGEIEMAVASSLSHALGLEQLSINDNIFNDLGGHSLSIALALSELREQGYNIGLSDFYQHPTIKELADYLQQQNLSKDKQSKNDKEEEFYQVSNRRYWFMGTVQLLSILFYSALLSFPVLFFIKAQDIHFGVTRGFDIQVVLFILLISTITFISTLTLPILFKWLLLGRVKEGKYKLWSSFAIRVWMVSMMLRISPYRMFKGTPLMRTYANLLGAHIDKDVILVGELHGFDMIHIGANSSIGKNSHLHGSDIRNGYLHFEKVEIGKSCFVGNNAVIKPNSIMEDSSYLGDQSLLQDAKVPKSEFWHGSPAQKSPSLHPLIQEIESFSKEKEAQKVSANFKTSLLLFTLYPLTILLVLMIPFLGSIKLSYWAYASYGSLGWLCFSPITALSFVLLLAGSIVLAHKLIMPSIQEGIYPINSWIYIRKITSDALIEISLVMMNGLYATLYLPPFLRMLGAKIGKHTEIATVSNITPSLLEIADESFLADISTIGPNYIHRGYFGVKSVKIGKRTFLGNASYVPSGATIPNESLIGVLSISPFPVEKMKQDSTWLGSPSFELPRRQESQYFDESLTFSPTKELYIKRWIYEFFRVTLPFIFFGFFGSLTWLIFVSFYEQHSALTLALILALLTLASGLSMTLLVAGIKKILIGTYTPKVKPLWDIFIRRSELVTSLYENITVPSLALLFTGTPFLAPILRLYGVKVGKRSYIETTFVTEFDLVEIGDDCQIETLTSLQTHLFEDRVMKMSYVKIGNACSIGTRSVILYDSHLENNVTLDSLSLVMKGETLPTHSRYRGIPVKRVSE